MIKVNIKGVYCTKLEPIYKISAFICWLKECNVYVVLYNYF